MTEYRYKEYISKWLSGEVNGNCHGRDEDKVSIHVRRYMFELVGNKCSKCGWNTINQSTGKCPLQINHIDGNSDNTKPENLEVLCPNCHALTPTFGALNRGKGRSKRREMRRRIAEQIV
jgi:5-methylcytosine-specific restriction endonuclease McrA